MMENIIYRKEAKQSDLIDFKELLASSGFFYPYEIEVAEGFLNDWVDDGEDSGLQFYLAEDDGKLVGFACFGFDACTLSTYRLYWLGIHNDYRNKGIGKALLKKMEDFVIENGGQKIVLETAGRELYKPTRDFYERNGYREEGIVPDYYSEGDARITYVKDVK